MSGTVLLPEVLVVAAALALLLSGEVRLRARHRRWLPWGALLVVVAALLLELWQGAALGTLFGGGYVQDRFALFAKAVILLALALAIAVADWDLETYRPVLPLALLAAFGGMVAASATNLLGLWAGLELAALAGVAAATGPARAPAGVRLLTISAVGAGLAAAGFGLIYGISGASGLSAIRAEMPAEPLALPLALAILLAVAGVAVTFGLVPLLGRVFMPEAPASPVGSAVLGGLAPTAAGIVLVKLLAALVVVAPLWAPYLAVLGALALVAGGLGALAAPDARSLAGWLVLAQSGWVAAGLAAHDRLGTTGALFALGALAIAAAALPALFADLDAESMAGLGAAEPGRAAGLALVLLSLAGTPPLVGFFADFGVAAGLLGAGLGWVLALGLLSAVLVLVAVAREVLSIYLAGPLEEPRRGTAPIGWSLGAAAAGVTLLALAILANPVSGLAFQGVEALGLR